MSEPDKAILWARERAARWQDEGGGEAGPSYRSGKLDGLLGEEVEGYRAGQAASAERIKALEEALRNSATAMQAHLEAVDKYNQENGTFLVGLGMRVMGVRIAEARNLLKEADQ